MSELDAKEKRLEQAARRAKERLAKIPPHSPEYDRANQQARDAISALREYQRRNHRGQGR